MTYAAFFTQSYFDHGFPGAASLTPGSIQTRNAEKRVEKPPDFAGATHLGFVGQADYPGMNPGQALTPTPCDVGTDSERRVREGRTLGGTDRRP